MPFLISWVTYWRLNPCRRAHAAWVISMVEFTILPAVAAAMDVSRDGPVRFQCGDRRPVRIPGLKVSSDRFVKRRVKQVPDVKRLLYKAGRRPMPAAAAEYCGLWWFVAAFVKRNVKLVFRSDARQMPR